MLSLSTSTSRVRGRAGGFFWTRAWKERAVKHGQFRFAVRIWNHDGKEACILVIHVAEIDIAACCESRESQALPMKEIFRNGERNPRAARRPCRVGHQISLQWLDERDARIFASTAAIRARFIISFRLKCDAQPLNTSWIAILIELHACNPDARIISAPD